MPIHDRPFDAHIAALAALDYSLLHSLVFHTRKAKPNTSVIPNTIDGTIPVAAAHLGFRLFLGPSLDAPLVLLWHGNRATVADYDPLALLFQRAGVSLMVVDYRGYGWSTGSPRGATLLTDAERVLESLPTLLAQYSIPSTVLLYSAGRSLGSAPAIHLVYRYPERFRGLLLESAFAHAPDLLRYFRLPHSWLRTLPDPWENTSKITTLHLPTLIVHGESDRLIDIQHAETLFAQSPARWKHLLRIPKAGHTQLMPKAPDQYLRALGALFRTEEWYSL